MRSQIKSAISGLYSCRRRLVGFVVLLCAVVPFWAFSESFIARAHGQVANELALSAPLFVGVIARLCRRLYTAALFSADISDDGLPSVIDVNMLNPDELVTAMTQTAKRLDLS